MGKYYGVVRNSSPTYVRATFGSKEKADAYVEKMDHPEDYHVIEF